MIRLCENAGWSELLLLPYALYAATQVTNFLQGYRQEGIFDDN